MKRGVVLIFMLASFVLYGLERDFDKTKENRYYQSEVERKEKSGPYKGSAILGNKNICYVYSEIKENMTNENGITHMYINDFTFDYLAALYPVVISEGSLFSSIKKIKNKQEKIIANESISWMEEYFQPKTVFPIFETSAGVSRTYPFLSGGIVLATDIIGEDTVKIGHVMKFQNKAPSISKDEKLKALVFTYSNGQKVYFAYKHGNIDYGYSKKLGDIIDLTGDKNLSDKRAFLFLFETEKEAGIQGNELYIIPEMPEYSVADKIEELRKNKDNLSLAKSEWDNWMAKGKMPKFNDSNIEKYYKINLAALLGVYLNGAIPADVTGQFVTDNMPQLYPRDALMSARSFYLAGHYEEAAKILKFWDKIVHKVPGEYYARYDAYGKATPGGSGAEYDVPEWDFNGYYTTMTLWLWENDGKWHGDLVLIKKMMQFLMDNMNDKGELLEGGIVEWPGYLPATHMNNIAGLYDAAVIFEINDDSDFSKKCLIAAEKMKQGLKSTYNSIENTYMDYRNGKFAYCSSFNFGYLWGYENSAELENSNKWILKNVQQRGGGIQYFDGRDGAEGYGNDLFIFTTAAASQYQAENGSYEEYKKMIDWMMLNSNRYSSMPERIYYPEPAESSPASPLSWCNGEFANALYYGAKRGWLVSYDDEVKHSEIIKKGDVISKYITNVKDSEKLQILIKQKKYDEAAAIAEVIINTCDLSKGMGIRSAKLLRELIRDIRNK